MKDTTILSSAEFKLPSGWYVAEVADFNGDGKSDLLWVNSNTGEAAIWYMNGTTILASAYLPHVSGWCAVGADDYSDLAQQHGQDGDAAVGRVDGQAGAG